MEMEFWRGQDSGVDIIVFAPLPYSLLKSFETDDRLRQQTLADFCCCQYFASTQARQAFDSHVQFFEEDDPRD